MHVLLRVVLYNLIGRDHHTAHILDTFGKVFTELDMDLEEYSPQ